jgi:hypothetical protein
MTLRKLIDSKGLEHRKVCESLKLDAPTFSRILAGKRKLRLEEAVGLAQILSLKLEDIVSAAGVKVGKLSAREDLVPIEGEIREGVVYPLGPGPLAPRPVGAQGDVVALRLPGNGLMYYRAQPGVDKGLLGLLCVCELIGGGTVVATLTRGQAVGTYDVALQHGQKLTGRQVRRAGPVLWVKY